MAQRVPSGIRSIHTRNVQAIKRCVPSLSLSVALADAMFGLRLIISGSLKRAGNGNEHSNSAGRLAAGAEILWTPYSINSCSLFLTGLTVGSAPEGFFRSRVSTYQNLRHLADLRMSSGVIPVDDAGIVLGVDLPYF